MSIQEYRAFIAAKGGAVQSRGMDPKPVAAAMKHHQRASVDFALSRGASALFLDTGLGKSFCELEWARQVAEETCKPSLILTPLAVAGQMVREGRKFGIDARQIREQSEVGAGIMVANYERLPHLDPASFGGVVLDESSILKSFAGKTRGALLDAFSGTRFRLAATATPSPNDHMELGNHAEFLGVMRQQEMLSRWFINDTSTASQEWRLKGHAVDDFWSWVASWSRCATMPSDLGGDDTGYILPAVEEHIHTVTADRSDVGSADAYGQSLLFRIPEMSATSFHQEKRLTMADRCERAAALVFSDFIESMEGAGCLGSQNTRNAGEIDTTPTLPSASAERLKAEAPKKTANTCETTAPGTLTGSQKPANRRSSSETRTPLDASDTGTTRNTLSGAADQRHRETRPRGETAACDPHTASIKPSTTECSRIKAALARFAAHNTKRSEGDDFTSTIATARAQFEGYCAAHATPRSESCETTQIACGQQLNISNGLKLDPWLIFCETNDEQDELEKAFGSLAYSIRGSDDVDAKEAAIIAWMGGKRPILISKPKIVGYGLNFQHCRNVLFASISFSFEQHYQAVRRVWRFGQDRNVRVHIVIADTEAVIWRVLHGKAEKHHEMKRRMADAMRRAQSTAETRVKYDRPLELAFPAWLQSKG